MATRKRSHHDDQSASQPEQGVGQDFSKQVDSELLRQFRGEHSFQVDHDGKSFRQAEQGGSGGGSQVQQHRQHSGQ